MVEMKNNNEVNVDFANMNINEMIKKWREVHDNGIKKRIGNLVNNIVEFYRSNFSCQEEKVDNDNPILYLCVNNNDKLVGFTAAGNIVTSDPKLDVGIARVLRVFVNDKDKENGKDPYDSLNKKLEEVGIKLELKLTTYEGILMYPSEYGEESTISLIDKKMQEKHDECKSREGMEKAAIERKAKEQVEAANMARETENN